MTNKLTVITLVIIFVLGNLFFSNDSYAETNQSIKDIQEKRENIKEELSDAEKQVVNLMSEIEELNKEMKRVKLSLHKKQETIKKTEQKISGTIEDIRILQDEIKALKTDIEKRQEILKDRISSYQQAGGLISYLEVLFGAESFTDFISRASAVSKITESDVTLMENLERDIHKVAEKQKLAMKKLDELNTMKAEQKDTLEQIKKEKLQIKQRRGSLEEKQQKLTALIDNLQSKDNRLASLEKKAKQTIAAAKKSSKFVQGKQNEAKVQANAENNDSSKELTEKADKSKKENPDSTTQKTITVTATAYTIDSAGGSGITYAGIDLRENPDAKVIAVDPNVIPLGSVVYVEGYGYAIAGDIGSAINGKKIDVYMPTKQAAIKWGVRTVKVTIQ